tara:strand:+ start:129 stop:701 length:573 start_codon:yes stop_codon:yes gene_type:complete
MANKDAAFGVRPIGKVGQNADNGGLSEHLITANATAIYQNDLVKLKSDGSVEVAGAGGNVVGSLNGVFFTDASTSKPTFANHLKASNTATDIKGFVYDDPYQRFEIQSNNTGASQLTDINNAADIEYTAGATPSYISKSELDDSTLAAGAATLKIHGLSRDPDNSTVGSANVNWIVSINEHEYGKGVNGI